MRLRLAAALCRRPGRESESGLPVDSIGGKRMSSLFSRVSKIHESRLLYSVTASGAKTDGSARRHGGFCFFWTPPRSWSALGSPLQKKHPWHLGVGPTRLASPGVTRARSGIQKRRHIMYPEQSNPHGLHRCRRRSSRTGKSDQKFTTFSLATKSSYKNKESGEYISHTEWHRCIVFGKSSASSAATLSKRAQLYPA